MILPDKVIRWEEGRVERTIEHMELRYGSADEGGWDDWLPVAFMGPPANGVVTVEFLVDRHSPENAGLVAEVLQNIHFYLIDECQIPRPPDFVPWAYAIYHCSTMSNVYSRAHWSYIAPDEPQQRPRAVQMPDGLKGYSTPARIPVKENLYWSIKKKELELLWWLGQFVGTWRVGDLTWDVGRGPDGYLEVRSRQDLPLPSLTTVLRDGVKVADPPGPLGPRPVALSEAQARVWLAPEEYPALAGGANTSSGEQTLRERIEERILELDEADQKRGWFWLWSHFARVQPVEHHDECLDGLRAEFRASHRTVGEPPE